MGYKILKLLDRKESIEGHDVTVEEVTVFSEMKQRVITVHNPIRHWFLDGGGDKESTGLFYQKEWKLYLDIDTEFIVKESN